MAKIPNLKSPHDDSALNTHNRVIDVVNQMSKRMQDLVANGQLTNSQYSQLLAELNGFVKKGQLSVSDLNKNLGKIDQSYLTPELIAQIAGKAPINSEVAKNSVTTEKIANFAVTPDKTSFFNTSGNLFDGNYLNGLLVRIDNGSGIMPVYNYDGYEGKVAIIPVQPGIAYTVTIDREEASAFRVGLHSHDKPFASYPTSNRLARTVFNGTTNDMTSSVAFVARENENYVFIYVSSEGVDVPMSLRESSLKSDFLPAPNPNSVTPDMTTFFQKNEKNMFDGNYVDGLLFGATLDEGRTFYLRSNYSNLLGKTAVIRVQPNTTYSAKMHDNDPESSFRIALMDSYPTFYNANISEGLVDDVVVDMPIGTVDKEYTFTTKSTTQYALVYVSGTGLDVRLMFEKGNNFSSYSNGNFIPLQFLDTEGIKNVMLSSSPDNLYKGDLYPGLLFRDGGGTILRPTNNYDGLQGRTAVIKVEPGKSYELDVDLSYTFSFRVGIDERNDKWQNHPATNELDRVLHDGNDTTLNHVEFSAMGTEQYVYVYYAHTGTDMPIKLVEKGASSGGVAIKDSKFNLPGDFNEIYESPELTDFWSSPDTITPKQYHDKFQALINKHKGISSYSKIGEDDFGNPLYVYKTHPLPYHYSTYWNYNPGDEGPIMPRPKILLLSNIHGREKNPSYAIYEMFKQMLEGTHNSKAMDSLLTHVDIVAIPLGSPNAFIDNSYENRNGVNVSRDFPPYGPLSQGESKTIFNEINKHKDADFFIDFHNMQPRHNLIGFSLSEDDFFLSSTLNVYRAVGRMWQKKDSRFPQDIMHRWAYTGGVNPGTIEVYVQRELGIPTTLIETPRRSQFITNDGMHGPKITQLSVDVLVNHIFACIRHRQ